MVVRAVSPNMRSVSTRIEMLESTPAWTILTDTARPVDPRLLPQQHWPVHVNYPPFRGARHIVVAFSAPGRDTGSDSLLDRKSEGGGR
jgi:hypothetical protein